MVKDWCNKGSTWDNTLAAMKGKKPSKKENDDLIALCIAAVNATLVIPHPTADDQPKCVACKTAVALHMLMPTNLVEGKRYELDYCNTCILVAEVKGVICIDNPASCGCPAEQFQGLLDCKSCYSKKRVIDRTGATCSKCGVDLGIGRHLLGTTKEWMILSYSSSICAKKRCAVEGCDKVPQTGCNGHCLGHATQEQKNASKKRCAVEGCDKVPQC